MLNCEKIDEIEEYMKTYYPDTKIVKNIIKEIPSLFSKWFFIMYNSFNDSVEISFNVSANPTRVASLVKNILKRGYDLRIFHEHYSIKDGEGNVTLKWGDDAKKMYLDNMEKAHYNKFTEELMQQITLNSFQYGGKQ